MPLIAVTASSERAARRYVDSMGRRGGDTRLLLPGAYGGVAQALEGVHGLLLTGGGDIHPSAYGQEVDPEAHVEASPARDRMELPMVDEALARDMPVLGICRGMQVLNVAFGGALDQDLPNHQTPDGRPVFHEVYVSPGSKLTAIIGPGGFFRCNSIHHQGVREPQRATSLLASAYSTEDGVVEALESPGHSWVIGVQFHPEREDEVAKSFLRVFDGFLDWAERYRVDRGARRPLVRSG